MTARDMARALGRRGGRARAKRLSGDVKRQIASSGGKARAASLQAARRVLENLRYAAAVSELQGRSITVTRVNAFEGPLPGIYLREQ